MKEKKWSGMVAVGVLMLGSAGVPLRATSVVAVAPPRPLSLVVAADKKDADKKEEEPKGEPMDVDKLPKVVVESVKKQMPGARITKALKLEDGNYFLDDVKVGKKTWDVTVTPKGKIVKKVENKDND